MLKGLLRDSLIYTISNVLSRGIVFFLLPILANHLSPEEFGILDLFIIFIALVGVTISGELSQGLARFTPEERHEKKSLMISSVLWITLALYIIFVFTGYLFSDYFSTLIVGVSGYSKVLILVLFLSIFIKIEYILRNQLRWDLRVTKYAYISIIYTMVHAISVYIALVHFSLGIFGYFTGQIIATLVALIISFLYNKNYIKFVFSIRELKALFSFSYPLVFSSLTIILSTYVDRIVIKQLLTLEDLGLYGMGYRFANMGSFLLVGVQGALMPIIYKEYKKDTTKKKLKEFFNLFYAAILSLLLLLIMFSKELLILLTSPEYYSVDIIIPILSAAVLFNGMYIFGVGIGIMKKTKIFLYVGVFSLVLNISLNFLLIPFWGISGASYATLITAILCFLFYMYFSQKYYPIRYNIIRIIVSSLLVALFYYVYNVLATEPFIQVSVVLIILKLISFFILSSVLFYFLIGKDRLKHYLVMKRII